MFVVQVVLKRRLG